MKNQNILWLSLICLAISFLSSSCKSGSAELSNQVKEGTIEYEITTDTEGVNPMMAMMMPKTAKGYFKDDQIKIEMSAGMGFFKSNILSNGADESFIVLMEMNGKKYYFESSEEDKAQMKATLEKQSIKEIGESEVAGNTGTKYEVTDEKGKVQTVVLSNNITSKNRNWFLPFKGKTGLPLEFSMDQEEIKLQLKATLITEETLEEGVFKYDISDYEKFDTENNPFGDLAK